MTADETRETRKTPRRTPRARHGERDDGRRGAPRPRPEPADEDVEEVNAAAGPATPAEVGPVASAARRAVQHVTGLTQGDPESVVSIEQWNGGWEVGVEMVEAYRIPDSADILAEYVVRVQSDGELDSYRRVRRYARGQVDRRWR